MIFFTADHHFGHRNIIKHCDRPFKNTHEMNEVMIERWNKSVGPEDTVYHLGDFAYTISAYEAGIIRAKLNGTIILIQGNHDGLVVRKAPELFKEIWPQSRYVFIEGHKLLLSHKYIPTKRQRKKHIHLFGHHHGTLAQKPRSYDVGVDANEFEPIPFDEITMIVNAQEYAEEHMSTDCIHKDEKGVCKLSYETEPDNWPIGADPAGGCTAIAKAECPWFVSNKIEEVDDAE